MFASLLTLDVEVAHTNVFQPPKLYLSHTRARTQHYKCAFIPHLVGSLYIITSNHNFFSSFLLFQLEQNFIIFFVEVFSINYFNVIVSTIILFYSFLLYFK